MSGKITALKLQKRNQQRVNVYLDGEFAFGLSRIVAAWLQVGQELSETKIAELKAQDVSELAHQQALKFLQYRPRSSAEIRRNLEGHDFETEIINEVITRLQRSGLVDDTSFAQAWVENRSEFRPRSRRALASELHQRGLDTDTIDQALADLDEETLAYQAGIKRSRKMQEVEWVDFRRKMSGFLARRGFSYDVISPVIERIWNEKKSDDVTNDNPSREENI